MNDYVFEVITYPDLTCFFGNLDLLKEFNKVLELSKNESKMCVYCSYDTTFNLGNFYVTLLVFRHTIFENDPVIPLAFMLHERKFQMVHECFWQHLVTKIPNLKKVPVPVVVDKEPGITNAMKKYYHIFQFCIVGIT